MHPESLQTARRALATCVGYADQRPGQALAIVEAYYAGAMAKDDLDRAGRLAVAASEAVRVVAEEEAYLAEKIAWRSISEPDPRVALQRDIARTYDQYYSAARAVYRAVEEAMYKE